MDSNGVDQLKNELAEGITIDNPEVYWKDIVGLDNAKKAL